jgi:glucose/mannose-6-phosphate isomerase
VSDLSRAAVEAVDAERMIDDVLAQPAHLGDALWRADSAGIPRMDAPGGLVVCGMGGSAIGADVAVAALGERAARPIHVVRDYALPAWAGGDALVVCASYSGDTEETLACYEAARELGAPRVAITTGGRLSELAREDGAPVMGVPGGMMPRAAYLYVTVGVLRCAAAARASPDPTAEVEGAAPLLGDLAGEWGPDAADGSEAKAIARKLHGSTPVVHGAGPTAPAAYRWKCQLNENAEQPAFASVLPEADHNEVCAWDGAEGLSAVFLLDDSVDPRVRRRLELTADLIGGDATVVRAETRGETLLERVLSAVLLGDLVSIYLAALHGVDPTRIPAIERLKAELRQP